MAAIEPRPAPRLIVPGLHPGAATLVAVTATTAIRLLWLAAQPADLYPDEAQYWFWAQHPALGYYSKPPMVAWLIALTTGALGNSEFAVRLSAPLLHAVAALLIYAIGTRLYDPRAGFWAALGYASLPGVSLSAFLISTDAALLPFWAAALYCFIRARESGGGGWWAAVGVAAGLGLLAKYAMAYWLLSAFALVLFLPEERRHLRPLLAATGLALLIYLPNLWWNWTHHFVSYRHLRDNADLGGPLFHPAAFLEFLGSQFGVFGPLFFAALIVMTANGAVLAERRARLLAMFALPTLAMMCVVSLLSRAQPNWAAPTYVAGTLLVTAWTLARGGRNFLAAAVALNLAGTAALFEARDALAAIGVELPGKYDPLHRLRGWRALGRQVEDALAAHPGLKVLADDRELVAALIYYVHPHPWDAVKWNPMRLVKDQWDLTNDLSRHAGEDFLAVIEHPGYGDLRQSFAEVEPLGAITIPLGPGRSRRYELAIARGFIGYPQDRR